MTASFCAICFFRTKGKKTWGCIKNKGDKYGGQVYQLTNLSNHKWTCWVNYNSTGFGSGIHHINSSEYELLHLKEKRVIFASIWACKFCLLFRYIRRFLRKVMSYLLQVSKFLYVIEGFRCFNWFIFWYDLYGYTKRKHFSFKDLEINYGLTETKFGVSYPSPTARCIQQYSINAVRT